MVFGKWTSLDFRAGMFIVGMGWRKITTRWNGDFLPAFAGNFFDGQSAQRRAPGGERRKRMRGTHQKTLGRGKARRILFPGKLRLGGGRAIGDARQRADLRLGGCAPDGSAATLQSWLYRMEHCRANPAVGIVSPAIHLQFSR